VRFPHGQDDPPARDQPGRRPQICAEGKTNLLTKFISKKGRPFNAFLVLDKKSGKVGFEFEERKPKAPKKKTESTPA